MVSRTRSSLEIRNYIVQGKMQYDIAEDFVEVKMTIKVTLIFRKDDNLAVLEIRIFFWKKKKKVTAYVKMFIQRLKQGINKETS